MVRRVAVGIVALAVVAAVTETETAQAQNGYVYAPRPYYVVPPATVYDPVILSPVPVPVLPPTILVPPYGQFDVPAPPAYGYGPYWNGAYPARFRYDGSGRYERSEYRVYTPFGTSKYKYKYDRRDGQVEYKYDFDD